MRRPCTCSRRRGTCSRRRRARERAHAALLVDARRIARAIAFVSHVIVQKPPGQSALGARQRSSHSAAWSQRAPSCARRRSSGTRRGNASRARGRVRIAANLPRDDRACQLAARRRRRAPAMCASAETSASPARGDSRAHRRAAAARARDRSRRAAARCAPTRARARAARRPRRSAPRTAASRCSEPREIRDRARGEPAAAEQPLGERLPRARVDDRRLGGRLGHAHDVRRDRALIGRRDHDVTLATRSRISMRTNRRCTRASMPARATTPSAVVASTPSSGCRRCRRRASQAPARRARARPRRAPAGTAPDRGTGQFGP